MFQINSLPLGLKLISTQQYQDTRGNNFELWRQETLPEINFVQENISHSVYGVVRGLHFQQKNPQGKLISVLLGTICDIALDIRQDSPTFGQAHREILDADKPCCLWIPPGFAHGFSVLSENAIVLYRMTEYYNPDDQICIKWNDPSLNIDWGITRPILSDKDKNGIYLKDYSL